MVYDERESGILERELFPVYLVGAVILIERLVKGE